MKNLLNYYPRISTSWNQGFPYNVSDPQNRQLGCVTIAVGQLMKFYKRPTNINWSLMPNAIDSPNNTLCDFLYKLRGDLNVTDDGLSTLWDAQNVLQNNGYNIQVTSHNINLVANSLRKGNPVYARGNKANNMVGHAWVIDGYRHVKSGTEYRLYMLKGHVLDYELKEEVIYPYATYSTYCHMNWGWGGIDDGWFVESSTGYPSGADIPYSVDRQEIIINSVR